MNEMTEVINYYQNQFKSVKQSLPGWDLPWLQQKRQDALGYFMDKGFPTRKDEEWKYTSVMPIAKVPFSINRAISNTVSESAIKPYLVQERAYATLVFIDGHFASDLSQIPDLPKGAKLMSLACALEKYPDELSPHLTQYTNSQAHAFSALNTAFMHDGVFLCLPAGFVCPGTIEFLFIATQANSFSNIRNLIVLEAQAQVNLVERFVGWADQAYLTNSITEVVAGAQAKLNHYKLQQESKQGYHVGTLAIYQQQSSEVQSHSFSLGGSLVRSDTHFNLADESVNCCLNGLYLAKDHQRIDHHTSIVHQKPNGKSREYYKGILSDKAHAVFNGKVYVAEGAQKTDAIQYNKNLLLSKQAEIDTKPQLEIFADDVKCAHGATVGQLDTDALFYLRARGIDEQNARHLLLHAFAVDIVQRVELSALRQELEYLLNQYL